MYSINNYKEESPAIHIIGDVGKARQPREKLLTDFSVNVLQNRNNGNGMNLELLNSIYRYLTVLDLCKL